MKHLKIELSEMVIHYLVCALWSSCDAKGNPLDRFSIYNFPKEDLERAEKDCEEFKKKAGDLINGISDEDLGHDFWLTRNGHGAGFWDRDYLDEETGKKLSDISREFGGLNVECYRGKISFL